MIKKLFWLSVIIFVLFLFFAFTNISGLKKIESTFGLEGLTENIVLIKEKIDYISTNAPSFGELQTKFEEYKNTFFTGVQDTKDVIDDVRVTLSGAEQTINDIKDGYDKTKEFIDNTSEKIDAAKETLDEIKQLNDTLNK